MRAAGRDAGRKLTNLRDRLLSTTTVGTCCFRQEWLHLTLIEFEPRPLAKLFKGEWPRESFMRLPRPASDLGAGVFA